jgi:hypothetical protein
MTNANIIMAGNVLSIPLVALAVWTQSFYVAVAAFAMKIFVSGSYYAPALTTVQDSVDPSMIGFCISAFMFFNTMAGMTAASTKDLYQEIERTLRIILSNVETHYQFS